MLRAKFGIEIEFTGITREKAAEIAASFLNGTYEEGGTYYDTKKVTAPDGRVWKFMSDGSITCQRKSQGRRVAAGRDYSVELVSPILVGENGLKELETVCWVLDICNAKVNDSCGFHVHMDAAGFNLDTWKNLTLTYKHLEHLIDAFMPRTRRNNTYCKTLSGVSDERIKSVRTIDGLREVFNNDRYHKVNFEAYSRHRTVEFRQHSGTTNFTKMENWIRFLNGLITFAKRSSLPSRMTLEGLPFLDGKQKLFFKLRTKKLAV